MDIQQDSDLNQNCEAKWSITEGLDAVDKIMRLFFKNEFDLSKKMFQRYKDISLYHSMGLTYHTFIYAVFTMEKPLIKTAFDQANESLSICEKLRRRRSIVGMFTRTDYNEYTDDEAHAEVCYGEVNCILTLLHFLTEQNLMSLIKVALRFRACNNAYKLSNEIMKYKSNWTTDKLKRNFEAGVHLGWGYVNVLFSHLPSRILKIIALVGISSDREIGMQSLHIAADELEDCYRSKLTCFTACFYMFYVEQFFGLGEADMPWVKRMTAKQMKEYPNGAFDLFFTARVEQLKGNATESIKLFNKCINVQCEFKQMHNVCRWDLCWAYAINRDWQAAADCALKLSQECKWSPATNMYQYASFLSMLMEEENRPELRPKIVAALKQVPELRARYAGKTIPPEKFALIKAERYFEDEELVLPAFELFLIWNVFTNSAERPEILTPILEQIVEKMDIIWMSSSNKDEKYFVLMLLQGVCLRQMKRFDEAQECFLTIIHNQDYIELDNYVPPHAAFELGMTHLDLGNYNEAKIWLDKARDDYSGFIIESSVHLRIHGALNKLKALRLT